MDKLLQRSLDLVNSDQTQSFIDNIVNAHGNDFMLSTSEKNALTEILHAANEVYAAGIETRLDDLTYDALHEMLELATDGVVNTTARSYSGSVVYHKFPSLRGTLDKIYWLSPDKKDTNNTNRRGLPDWVATSERAIEQATGQKVDLWNEQVVVFPKWDGVSAIFEFNPDGSLSRVLTRGYTVTNEAQDITHIFSDLGITSTFGNCGVPHAVKTEVMMKEADLATYNDIYGTTYKNSRSIVASIINSKEADARVKYLQIIKLRTSKLLDDSGEESRQELMPEVYDSPHISCKLKDVDDIYDFAMNHKYTEGLRCDGAVIYLLNEKYRKILGRKDEKEKSEVAFKFTEETAYSKVRGIEFRVGLLGRIAPVLQIKPVKMKGNTISSISLGSMPRFNSLKLAVGDTVKVLYDIIPYAVFDENDPKCRRSGERMIPAPTNCPICGRPLALKKSKDDNDDGLLYCENEKCPCRIKGRILNFLDKMDIEGISYATVDVLYDEGILTSIADIYNIPKHKRKIKKIDGFGEQSVNAMIDSINSHREVTEAKMLGSLGIDTVGRKMFEKLLAMVRYDEVLDLCINDTIGKAVVTFSSVPGIGQKMSEKIYYGIRNNAKLIARLEDELHLVRIRTLEPSFTVVFTKVRDKDLEKKIESLGGAVADNVTAKTDLVIIPNMTVTSSKIEKAKKRGVPVVPIQDAETYIESHLL